MKLILIKRKKRKSLIWNPLYSDLIGFSSDEWWDELFSSSLKSSIGIFDAIRGDKRVSVT